jgi:hypothetical protein
MAGTSDSVILSPLTVAFWLMLQRVIGGIGERKNIKTNITVR